MRLELLMPLSGPNGTFETGDEVVVANDATALRYIEKGIAKFKNKKEHDSFLQKVDDIKEKESQKKAQAEAILKRDEFVVELKSLCSQVVIKAAEFNGKALDENEIVAGTEEILNLFLEERQDENTKQGFFSTLFFGKK